MLLGGFQFELQESVFVLVFDILAITLMFIPFSDKTELGRRDKVIDSRTKI